jgi:cytochrome c-type biogenesis protein CcmF
MAGTIGNLLILIALVACALSGLSFYQAARPAAAASWQQMGRGAWLVMQTVLVGTYGILLYLTLTHQFQYAYVFQNSSRELPLYYLVSSTWAGQEGSFLLWILLNGWVGVALMRWARSYEAPVMAVVAFCQFFLLSMIAGLQLGSLHIGSSPFTTLMEKFPDAPILQQGRIPENGQGLNDLLQNYWMVIHPPTLFTGFAAMIVPFAFAVTALWKRQYTAWVRPALPWTLFAVMVLGIGIAMGGYWAYVTLSFGGYWAWDPVENSSLVPWIIGVAAVHTMIVQKKSGSSHKAALLLAILAYMLVIYSTFLTRSGILGDISVHSFVDLGLYNQLLLWILSIAAVGFGLFALRYRELPKPAREPAYLSREFMIFLGAMLLCALGAVVILGTSAPILGRLFRDNPSSVPIAFYNKWSLPLSVAFMFLVGLGQLFWWHKMTVEKVNRVLLLPITLAVASTLAILLLTPFTARTAAMTASLPTPAGDAVVQAGLLDGLGTFWAQQGTGLMMLLLLFVSFFAFYGNGLVAWHIARGNPRMAGGALSHLGLAVMILGIIASSGFSNPLAQGDGMQMGDNRDNFVLERGQTRTVSGYQVTYQGQEQTAEGRPRYVLQFVDPQGRAFTVKPVVYQSGRGQWIQHPDLRLGLDKDLFVAVSPNAMFDTPAEQQQGVLSLQRGQPQTLGANAFSVLFENFDLNVDPALKTDTTQIAVAAVLKVTNTRTGETREARPVYLVSQGGVVEVLPNRFADWNLTLAFQGMNVNDGSISLGVEGVAVTPEDWLVVQAYEKPLINLVWLGILLLSAGFTLALYRRAQDYQQAGGTRTPT